MYLMSMYYRRHELQWRFNLFFSAVILAGAWSGVRTLHDPNLFLQLPLTLFAAPRIRLGENGRDRWVRWLALDLYY